MPRVTGWPAAIGAFAAAAWLYGMGHAPVSQARLRLREIRDYVCYYGHDRLEDLAKFGLVILEAHHHAPESIASLRRAGGLVVGYLSVGQADSLDQVEDPSSWTLDRLTVFDGKLVPGADGEPDRDPQWQSYYVDPNAKAWRSHLDREADRLLREFGCDGIFLDTLLYPYEYDEAFRRHVIEPALVSWIKRLRRRHPEAILVANNGWAYLDRLGPVVDAIMYEDFTVRYAMNDVDTLEQSERVAARLAEFRATRRELPLMLLALDYAEPEQPGLIRQARKRAERFGFLHSVSTKDANGIELYVIETVNPANQLAALRQDGSVAVSWTANRLHVREAGVDSYILKRAAQPIVTDADWDAAETVEATIPAERTDWLDGNAPAWVQWYTLGAVQRGGLPLIGRLTAEVAATPASAPAAAPSVTVPAKAAAATPSDAAPRATGPPAAAASTPPATTVPAKGAAESTSVATAETLPATTPPSTPQSSL